MRVKSSIQTRLPHFVDIFQKCVRIEQLRSLSLLGHVCLQLNWDKKITEKRAHLNISVTKPHTRGVRKPQCEGCGEKFPAGGIFIGARGVSFDANAKTPYFHKLACRISLRGLKIEEKKEKRMTLNRLNPSIVVHIFNN